MYKIDNHRRLMGGFSVRCAKRERMSPMANTNESYSGKINRKLRKKQRIVRVAAGLEPADLVLKHATYVNVFSNELCTADIAVAEGLIVGMGTYDLRHAR